MPRPTLFAIVVSITLATPAAAGPEPIFLDGFESGDACGGWTSRPPIYVESFGLADGSPLPAEWTIGGGIELADVQQGRARLRPVPSSFAPGRVVAAIPTMDVDVRFIFSMEDVSRQGVGLYVRQNGGYLTQTVPEGEGYGVFLEGFSGTSLIGIWRERLGTEERLLSVPTAFSFADDVSYRARYRVNQMTPTETLLQAKVWPLGDPEPATWNLSLTDDLGTLQNTTAGIALDVFTLAGDPGSPSGTFDDIVIDAVCNPLAGRGPVVTLGDAFIFTEGPLWRGDHLLFTELATPGDPAATAILRFDPPATFGIERAPSDFANGLELTSGDDLLACEHATRRVSITPPGGAVTTLVGDYQGAAFNSPNDLALRSDGTLYFTDPSYGMPAHGQPREIAFNGLYRRTPGGALSAEWEGSVGLEEPNGVALSPDESILYATDTARGELLAWDVAEDGALSNMRVLRGGLDTPDGLCIDRRGNIFAATWDQAIEVFAPDGVTFGRIPLDRDATNCAFGGEEARTLFVTAQDQLYAVELALPGIP